MEFLELESLIKLAVAAILGAVVGLERGTHGRPAGLRTHSLVCVASALLIIVSRTGALQGIEGPDRFVINMDPSRMAAGIVTGIGFLGAGAILRIGDSLVRGLTTAACVWFVAAVGIAVGMGAYGLASVATVGGLVILTLLDRLEGVMGSVAYRTLIVAVSTIEAQHVEQRCRALLKERKMRIQAVRYHVDKAKMSTTFSFSVRVSVKADKAGLVSEIASLGHVTAVDWS